MRRSSTGYVPGRWGHVRAAAAALAMVLAFAVSGVGVSGATPSDKPAEQAAVTLTACTQIDEPGTYELGADLSSNETCLTVTDSDVVVDGNGHTIAGDDPPADQRGIHANQNNVTVRDVTVTGWSAAGVRFSGVDHGTITNVTATANFYGIHLDQSAQNSVRNTTVTDSADNGIHLFEAGDNMIADNVVRNSSGTDAIALDGSTAAATENVVRDNELTGNAQHAVGVLGTDEQTVTGNTMTGNGDTALNLIGSQGSTVTDNNLSANGRHGVFLDGADGNTLRNNTASANDISGIDLANSADNTIEANTLTDNTGHGIWLTGSTNNTIRDNVATGNAEPGITLWEGSDANTVTDNTARENAKGGLRVGGDTDGSNGTVAARNTLTDNGDAGLIIEISGDTTLRNTTTTDNAGHGVFVAGSSNTTLTDARSVRNSQEAVRIDADSTATTVTRLDVGDSTAANTTLSFSGQAVRVDSAADVPTNRDAEPIGRYAATVGDDAAASLEIDLHYAADDLAAVDEGTLSLWRHDGTTWTELDATVNQSDNVASATLTTFGTVGIFGEITNSVTLDDQTVENGSTTVTVAEAVADVGYYVTVTDENGTVLATTDAFDGATRQTDLSVSLDEPLTAGQTLTASLHDASTDAELASDEATITVTGGLFDAPIPGTGANNAPTDTDGDGLLDDVDGDGGKDFDDAVALAFADTSGLTAAQREGLDFDGDGDVDFDDAVELAFL